MPGRSIRAVAAIGADLAAGFGMLTRLPVGWLVRSGMPYRPGRAVWCYPLAGALVGGVAFMVLLASRAAGMTSLLGAAWTLSVSVWLTGGLHEDGLADLADGCGGGRTPEARLSIMRDSRIGAFGALALLLALGIRLAALDRLGGLPVGQMVGWLVASGALSRVAMLPVLMLPPARADGLGRSLGMVARPVLLLALTIGAGIAVSLLSGRQAAAAIVVSLLTGWVVARFVRSRLGGRTGDALGACVMAAECGLLSLATTLARGL